MMLSKIIHLTVFWCWWIFLIYWTFSALKVKQTAECQPPLANLAYRVPLLSGGILLWLPTERETMKMALTPQTDLVRVLGAALCVLGLLVTLWARRVLADNWSSSVTLKQGHELIQSGPYRYARHLIYTGLVLMCLATALASEELHCRLGCVFLFAGFWIKLSQEDSLLLRHFPNDYPYYRARVKALIPFVL